MSQEVGHLGKYNNKIILALSYTFIYKSTHQRLFVCLKIARTNSILAGKLSVTVGLPTCSLFATIKL